MMLRLAAALAALMISSPSSAVPPRQPTGQWVVNFDAAQCFAARNYGTVEKPLYLIVKAPPIGGVMQVAVMRKGRTSKVEQQRGSLQFDDLEPLRISLLDYVERNAKLRSFLVNVPLEKFAAARNASSIRISTPGLDERFALSSMAGLLKTMDECVADLRRVWNISDPDSGNSILKERAKGELRRLFDADDYPTQALYQGDTGTVAIAIMVDELGKVADCSIIATSGVPVLDAQACAVILERGRFTPAIGPDGKPAKSGYVQRITWLTR